MLLEHSHHPAVNAHTTTSTRNAHPYRAPRSRIAPSPFTNQTQQNVLRPSVTDYDRYTPHKLLQVRQPVNLTPPLPQPFRHLIFVSGICETPCSLLCIVETSLRNR